MPTNDANGKALDARLFRRIAGRATSLDERIVAEIRTLIDTGQIAPGDRLPAERELAQALNVSRASLREALRRLAALGLVEIRWGQGVFVRTADLDFILERLAPVMLQQGSTADLYEIRRLLEVEAAAWAAERASDDERAELALLTDQAEADVERVVASSELAREYDQRYHNLIAQLSHNQVLVRIMESLLDLLAEVRQRSFAIPGRARHSLEEHRQITNGIIAGDAAAARQSMLRHLRNAENAVRGTLSYPG